MEEKKTPTSSNIELQAIKRFKPVNSFNTPPPTKVSTDKINPRQLFPIEVSKNELDNEQYFNKDELDVFSQSKQYLPSQNKLNNKIDSTLLLENERINDSSNITLDSNRKYERICNDKELEVIKNK